MEPFELLRVVVTEFERLGLPYLVTGSIATILYGEPRFTNDIDIVIELSPDKIQPLCRAFPASEFYLSEDAVRQAFANRDQFNIIHPASGLKIDVIIPQESDFNRSRFARAQRVSPSSEYSAMFASREDVIIKKMEFYREGGAEKHLRDITGVLKVSGQRVDRDYVHDWAARLGLLDIWRAVQGRVDSRNSRNGPSHDEAQR